jgi:hypothetical protein
MFAARSARAALSSRWCAALPRRAPAAMWTTQLDHVRAFAAAVSAGNNGMPTTRVLVSDPIEQVCIDILEREGIEVTQVRVCIWSPLHGVLLCVRP